MIARLRELLAAATPGEWEGVPNHPMPTADYDLIVTAHNALPALLDVVEAAKAMRTGKDCPMCDSGKLRNPAKEHWDTCAFAAFDAALKRLEGGE